MAASIPDIPLLPSLGGGQLQGLRVPLDGDAAVPVTANLALHLKSDTGTFQAAAGAAAELTNDPVGEWQDQSGNGRHVVQATALNKPTLQPAAVNGKPGVRFDGSNDYLRALFTLNRPFHVFLVVKQITWVSARNIIAGGTGDTYSLLQNTGTPTLAVWGGTSTAGQNSNLAVGAWGIVESLADAVTRRLRVNDTAATTPSLPTVADRGGITLGAHANNGSASNIEVAELLVYSAELTGADLTAVRSYLGTRYGIAV
jgi:hypothetical protein